MKAEPQSASFTQRLEAAPWQRMIAVIVLLAVASLLAWAVDGALSLAIQTLIYLLPVALSAVYLRGVDSIVTAVLGAILLNFLFIPPRYTLEVEGPEYLLSLSALLGLSFLLNALVAQLKRETAAARLGEARMAALHELGQVLALSKDEGQVAAAAAAAISRRLDMAVVVDVAATSGAPPDAAHPDGATFELDRDAVVWVLDRRKALGRGSLNWPTLDCCIVPLKVEEMTCIGVLAVDLRATSSTWQADDLEHLEALASLIASAVQRLRLGVIAQDAAADARLESTRSALLASISHDLRTPLAVIVGSASTLREQSAALTQERREALLRTVESEAMHMATIAENVLQMARLSAGSLVLARDWESMEEIVGAVVARLRQRDRSRVLIVNVPADLPLVHVDAVLIAQVLTNLIENAFKHAEGGATIEISTECIDDRIETSVSDRGPGLGTADTAHLFDAATRKRKGGSPGRAGSGLGLSICRAIVQAHAGTITAANRDGGGATFRFALPLAQARPPVPADPGSQVQ